MCCSELHVVFQLHITQDTVVESLCTAVQEYLDRGTLSYSIYTEIVSKAVRKVTFYGRAFFNVYTKRRKLELLHLKLNHLTFLHDSSVEISSPSRGFSYM